MNDYTYPPGVWDVPQVKHQEAVSASAPSSTGILVKRFRLIFGEPVEEKKKEKEKEEKQADVVTVAGKPPNYVSLSPEQSSSSTSCSSSDESGSEAEEASP